MVSPINNNVTFFVRLLLFFFFSFVFLLMLKFFVLQLAETLATFPDGTERVSSRGHAASGKAETAVHLQPQVRPQERQKFVIRH